ncbi:hypothetical protein ACIP02_21640 [Pseudomonas sp. NPDC089408]|uniref:hypothetical protein n=1 Tax=Pseudomonas sp. NPDC089408 TaxID=3364465 RepID=UPI0037F2EE87
MVDIAIWREKEKYLRYVFDALQHAGIVDPSMGMPLAHLDKDKCEYALMVLELDHRIRLRRDYRTVGELAGGLCSAIEIASEHHPARALTWQKCQLCLCPPTPKLRPLNFWEAPTMTDDFVQIDARSTCLKS